jgi:hypothetical protein
MPQQTNDFQKLVTLIQRTLAPEKAKVTPCAMVPCYGTAKMREIDVLIESEVGPYNIKIAVEAKDHKRKLDVTHIEAMIGKYKSSAVQVNKVVVISHRGFTEEAKERAERENIELKILKEAMDEAWVAELPKTIHVRISPHILDIELLSSIKLPAGKRILTEGVFMCSHCGRKYGTPKEMAEKWLFQNPELMRRIIHEASQRPEGTCAKVEMAIRDKWILRYKGNDYRITAIKVHVHCIDSVAPLRSTAWKFGDKSILHATAETAGKKIDIVMPDGKQSKKIALSIDSIKHAAKKKRNIEN